MGSLRSPSPLSSVGSLRSPLLCAVCVVVVISESWLWLCLCVEELTEKFYKMSRKINRICKTCGKPTNSSRKYYCCKQCQLRGQSYTKVMSNWVGFAPHTSNVKSKPSKSKAYAGDI